MKATLVTALFRLPGRDTHKFELYKQWCKHLSALDSPMVIYVDEYYFKTFTDHRERVDPNYEQTIFHKITLEDLEVYRKYGASIADSMQSESFRRQIKFPGVPEMQYPWYNIIMYNKLCFLRDVSQGNPFGTDMFCWLDAGGIRSPTKNCHMLRWPNNFTRLMPSKMNMFTITGAPPFLASETERYVRHCFGQWRFIQGRCFLGDTDCISLIHSEFFWTLEWCLSRNLVGSDEKLFDFCFAQRPELFNLIGTTPPDQWTQFFDILT